MLRAVAGLLASVAIVAGRGQDVQALLHDFAKAVNSGNEQTLAGLAAGDPKLVYPYFYKPGAMHDGWRAELLELPGGSRYAVLTKPQPWRSEADHVHPVLEGRLGPEIPESETFGYRIRDHRLTVTFDLGKHAASFEDVLTLERTEPEATDVFLRISPDFKVTRAAVGPTELSFRQAGGVVWIERPPASRVELRLEYGGRAYHDERFVSNSISEQEVVLTAYWYPTIGRLPALYAVTVTVPRGWTAVGDGDLVARTDAEETSTFRFEMAVPTVYFALDAGPYYIYERRLGGRVYRVLAPQPVPDEGASQLDLVDEPFRRFEEWFGAYPWDGYALVYTQLRSYGSLPSCSLATCEAQVGATQEADLWAHAWWGGIVPGTYLDSTWPDSFASYSCWLYRRRPNEEAPAVLADMHYPRVAPGAAETYGQVSLAESADALNPVSGAVGREKGRLVLSYLEYLLGFDTFLKACRRFRDDLVPGEAATWVDFERAVWRATGDDYKWFFDQWVGRPGLPKLWWEDVKAEPSGDKWLVSGKLRQSSPPYRLTVEVLARGPGRSDRWHKVQMDSEQADVRFEVPFKPTAIVADPELRIPREIVAAETPPSVSLLPWQIDGTGTILVVPADLKPQAEELAGSLEGLQVRVDEELTEEESKTHNLVMVGGPDSNRVWRRYASWCPFAYGKFGLTFLGTMYEGRGYFAASVAEHPESPGRLLLFMNDFRPVVMGPRWARSVLLDPEGQVVAGEVARIVGGPSVHRFDQ
jgi:hypothetical protein